MPTEAAISRRRNRLSLRVAALRIRIAALTTVVSACLFRTAASSAADCEFTALDAAAGVTLVPDWRLLVAPLAGFLVASLVLVAALHWRGRGAGTGLAAVSQGFGRGPRQALLAYLLLLAALIPAAYIGLGRAAPEPGLHLQAHCYSDLRLYQYPDQGIAFYNRDWPGSLEGLPAVAPGGVEPLVVPVGETLTLDVRNFQIDAPGWRGLIGTGRPALPRLGERLHLRFEKAGEYRGFCRSVCTGVSADSPLAVRVVSAEEYALWRRRQAEAQPTGWADAGFERLMSDGERVYRRRCSACHGEQGQGSGALFPGLRGSAMLRGPVEGHVLFVWYGRPGSPMKAFAEELSLYEMAAVTTYQRNAWGLQTGDRLQAADIQALVASR